MTSARLEHEPPTRSQHAPVPDDLLHPRPLADRQIAHRSTGRPRAGADEESLHAVRGRDAHPDAEQRRQERHARPLHEHREEHDDDDDVVDPPCAVDALQQHGGAEQNWHGSLQAAPHDKDALAPAQPQGKQHGPDRERPGDEGKQERKRDAVQPDVVPAQVAEMEREPKRGEDDDLSEACQRGVESLDVALVWGPLVTDEQPGDEHRQEARSVGDGRGAVDGAREGKRA